MIRLLNYRHLSWRRKLITRKKRKKRVVPAVALVLENWTKGLKIKRRKAKKLRNLDLVAHLQVAVLDLAARINQNLKIKSQIKGKRRHLQTKRKIKALEVPVLHLVHHLAQMVWARVHHPAHLALQKKKFEEIENKNICSVSEED